jgi:hypothetical protein
MGESLEGATYEGHFLVADIAMQTALPRDQTSFVCTPDGLLLLSPLPGGRWISFQDLEEEVQTIWTAARILVKNLVDLCMSGYFTPV